MTAAFNFSHCVAPEGAPFEPGHLLQRAYQELPEFHRRPEQVFVKTMQDMIEEHTRVELYARNDRGDIVGGIIAGVEQDPHAGVVLTALLQYVDPAVRGTAVYRKLFGMYLRAGRMLRVDACLYSHRVGPGKYLNTYRSF